jgi:hypothetical membrane protein
MQQSQKNLVGALSGIVAPIVAFTCITVAIAFYPPFNWANNALSDLGIISGITGPVFNFGLIACGLLTFIFAVFGLFNFFKSQAGKAGSIMFAATAVALIAIGVFNENYSPMHYIFSVAFFMLAPLSLFVLTSAFGLSQQLKLAVFTVSVGVAAAIPWILEFTVHYVPNVAIPETVSGLAVSVWAIVLSKKMLSVKSQSD